MTAPTAPDVSQARGARRRMLAVSVLVLWIAGLGLLARRELFRPHFELLAQAGLRVNQATTFFGVSLDTGLVGYASSIIDTTRQNLIMTNYMVTEISGPRPRSTSRAKITLSRTFKLKEFETSVLSNTVNLSAKGQVHGDTSMTFTLSSGDGPPTVRTIHLDGIVLLPQLVPLAIALTTPPTLGQEYSFPVFDPARQQVIDVKSSIRAESVFVIPDSAALDSTTHMWVAVRSDTVRAWQVASTAGGFNGWLDAEGHVVKTVDLGSNVDRTTYEQSFENWVLTTTERRMLSLPPAQRPPGWKPTGIIPQRGGRPPNP